MFSNNALLALGLAGILSPAEAFFRMSCPGRLVRERLDPIINPGGVSTHVHTISGGSAFSAEMTFEQQRAAKCSSCTIKEDMSNYWTPQLYGFPEGFRMLAGDPAKRSFTGGLDAKAINFNCLGANKPETNDIPNYNCPGGLRAQVFFPSCWNGKDLDSEDHRSHMSYPAGNEFNTGSCPPEFPVHFISIFFEVLYDTNKYVDEWEGDQHPFVFANGDPTGYGFHGDFINGWDVDVLQEAVDTCTDDSGQVEKCGAVTQFTAAECNACKLPATVNEKVDGHLEKLPGCNPVSAGPERQAPSASCPAVEMGNPEPNFVDLTASKKWEYLGCGTDDKGARALSGDNDSADDMTVDKCIDFCSGAGFTYAGLEFGRECYCGNELPEANAPQDGIMGSCTMECAGDDSQFCGNAGALSLYRKCDGECKN
ncbi:WSC-domain-containing protein, partial [Corynespora cassiicola Philippines]